MEASPETLDRIRHDLGLDRPLPVQFGRYVLRVLTGDLGTSIRTGSPVAAEIAERFPVTMWIAVLSTLLATALGIALGVVAALHHNRFWDGCLVVLSLLAASTPSYWLALMLMLAFSLSLGLLPSIGIGTPWHYVLPVTTLAAQGMGTVARLTRSSMLDVIRQEYVAAATARGLPRRRVVVGHALANALVPVVSAVGLRFGVLLAGTVLVESVFAIPGLGRLVVDAVLLRDYPVVQGGILAVAAMFVAVNALTDVVYAAIDPRIRLEG
jgi:ABC-type dipeptide/oligopeptide/nickel transport system permease component